MKTKNIIMLLLCMSAFSGYAQMQKKCSPFSLSVETQVPVQNDIRLSYSMGNLSPKTAIGAFLQFGMPAYLDESIDIIFDKSEKANQYLKDYLGKKEGLGVGIWCSINHWQIDIQYQNTAYKIKERSGRELIENLAPESDQDVVIQLNDFADKFPPFSNIYDNYLLTPNFRLHQLVVEGGYKFQFQKQSRIGIQVKGGMDIFFDSSLHTTTEQKNRAADFLVKVVNNAINQKINTKIQGRVKPIVSFSIHYAF